VTESKLFARIFWLALVAFLALWGAQEITYVTYRRGIAPNLAGLRISVFVVISVSGLLWFVFRKNT
jgi:CDP-diglyceride synthetase